MPKQWHCFVKDVGVSRVRKGNHSSWNDGSKIAVFNRINQIWSRCFTTRAKQTAVCQKRSAIIPLHALEGVKRKGCPITATEPKDTIVSPNPVTETNSLQELGQPAAADKLLSAILSNRAVDSHGELSMAKQTASLRDDVPGCRSLGFSASRSHRFTSKPFNLSAGTRGEAC